MGNKKRIKVKKQLYRPNEANAEASKRTKTESTTLQVDLAFFRLSNLKKRKLTVSINQTKPQLALSPGQWHNFKFFIFHQYFKHQCLKKFSNWLNVYRFSKFDLIRLD